jgi:recombination associated protein RdgC
MWFKNLQIYRLPAPWGIDLAALDEQLARGAFSPCPSHQPLSRGWTPPRQESGLVYGENGQWLLALTTEQRLLPASVINETAQERAERIASEQGYPPGRKQMKELRERVTEELMPRAFTKKSRTFVWVDPKNGWFIVDAGSQGKAEEVIEHLRFCLDEFPLKPLHTQRSPQSAMADWLAGGSAPAGFTIDRDCELKSVAEEKAAVRYVRHPLDGDGMDEQIRAHLAAGKLPTRLALTWDERISFILTEKLEIKRLAFLDLLKEEAEKAAEHAEEQFAADFALMTGELARFLPQLTDALGGETQEAPAPGSSATADTPPWEN